MDDSDTAEAPEHSRSRTPRRSATLSLRGKTRPGAQIAAPAGGGDVAGGHGAGPGARGRSMRMPYDSPRLHAAATRLNVGDRTSIESGIASHATPLLMTAL